MKFSKAERLPVFIVLVIVLCAQAGAEDPSAPTGPYLGQPTPGDSPKLFAPGIISIGKEHSAAMFIPDGSEIWFGRMFPAKVYYIKRIGDRWGEPQIAPFCDTFNYLYPVLTRDGKQVFFSSNRPPEPHESRLQRGGVGIWKVERTSDGWTEPKRLNSNVNSGRSSSCGSVAANGSLYFTRRDVDRSTDMFCSRLVGGTYDAPEKLTEINSSTPDHSPFVAPDESYLIFSSFRGGYGRSDLFISFREDDGTWSEPRNMGSTINSAYKDEYPYVTADGKYLFFNSNRPSRLNQKPIKDGPGNIYWIDADIIDEMRP